MIFHVISPRQMNLWKYVICFFKDSMLIMYSGKNKLIAAELFSLKTFAIFIKIYRDLVMVILNEKFINVIIKMHDI